MAQPQKKKKIPLSWLRRLLLLTIPTFWCILSYTDNLGFIENKMLDFRFRSRGEIPAAIKLIYVDIDNDAIQAYKWPWNHSRFAQVLDALFEQGKIKAVGFDIVFSDYSKADFGLKEQNEGRLQFGKAVRKYQNVVLAANYVPGPGMMQTTREFPWIFDGFTDPNRNDTPELPAFPIMGPPTSSRPGWGIPGLIDTYQGEARSAPIFADTPIDSFYPLSLRLALIHWGLTTEALVRHPNYLEVKRPTGEIVTKIPLIRGQIVEGTWFSKWKSKMNPRCSVADLGENLQLLESPDPKKREIGKEFFAQFNDAIVLVGPVDPLLQDLAKTPFDDVPVPQVGFHGNLIKTFVTGIYLRRIPNWASYAITFVLTITVVLLSLTEGSRGLRYKVLASLILVFYIVICFVFFTAFHFVLPMSAPLLSTIGTSLAAIAWQLFEEQKAKGRIKGMFGTYVSPQLVESMIASGESPQLGGHEAEITPYFSDIQSFSTFSEKLQPAQLVELMNEYLTACTDIILAQGGALDKYIGDAVVAMFGGLVPLQDHAYRACVASQLVHLKLGELREKWRAEADKWPEIVGRMQSRIGLNSGLTTVGNMGSHARFNYTMMGDNVNLAARMESGAKAYGVYTMVSEATKLACEQHGGDHVVFRYLDRIVVKGRTIPVPIYEIVGLKEHVTAQTRECVEYFAKGIERYLAQDWDGAEAFFRQSAELEPNQPGKTPGVENNPSLTLLARCTYMRSHPPGSGWDGVYVMKEK
ncbi:MAG: adenylate/guanylate cyclase with Chase sensor [Verrucomicrobia bacterium]|nr:adenylate/guanylate cyclase with Chase sensor [Verrucomicrobiota bacterium]